jgi:hypothetical protein
MTAFDIMDKKLKWTASISSFAIKNASLKNAPCAHDQVACIVLKHKGIDLIFLLKQHQPLNMYGSSVNQLSN